nr:hypothetical protein [Tanacetum cinerariifolium]
MNLLQLMVEVVWVIGKELKNAEGKGILKSRPKRKPVNQNRPKLVSVGRPNPISAVRPNPISADQPNPVSSGQPNTVSAGDGILSSGPLNIQSKSTYFHYFIHNNQQIFFLITINSLYSLYLTGGLNGKTAVMLSAGWPWTNYGMSKTKGSKINGGSKSKSWSFAKGPLGNKDKLEDFEDFHGTINSLYSLYLTGGLNGKTAVMLSAGWPWTNYGMSKTKGSKINGGSKSKSWSFAKGPLGRPKLEKAKDKGIVDSGCS